MLEMSFHRSETETTTNHGLSISADLLPEKDVCLLLDPLLVVGNVRTLTRLEKGMMRKRKKEEGREEEEEKKGLLLIIQTE